MTLLLGKWFELEVSLTTLFLRVGKRQLWLQKGGSVYSVEQTAKPYSY